MRLYFGILLMLCLLVASCKKTAPGSICNLSPLHELISYPVGVAIDINKLNNNAAYTNLAANQFNRITPENILKFDQVHPARDRYSFASMDKLIYFARLNNQSIHGHTLLWHRAVPGWVENFNGDWNNLIQEHITTVVSKYKHNILSWDVVNEAINEDGTLRNSVWLDHIGPGYIPLAFKTAHKAAPGAMLFYNDYNLAINPVKLDAAINLCTQLRAKGIHIDGIGMQMHITADFPGLQDIETAIRKITDAGFLVHISELDISMNILGTKTGFSEDDMNKQAELYANIFRLCKQFGSDKIFGITMWGISDADTWITTEYGRADIPLLFDSNYNPKPAYCRIKELFE